MAFNSNPGEQGFIATTGQIDFDFNFKIFKNTDILVYQTPSGQTPNDASDILILTTDYTVTITGDAGGKVSLVTGAGMNDTLVLRRNLLAERDTEYQTSGDLLATTLNDDQDYQTYLIADNNLVTGKSITIPDSAVGVTTQLQDIIPSYFLRWNAAGTAIENAQAVVQEITEFKDNVFKILKSSNIAITTAFILDALTASRTITMPDTNIDLDDINTLNKLDNSITIDMPTDGNLTLTADQIPFGIINITDIGVPITAPRNITVDTTEHTFLFINNADFALTVKTPAGTGITVIAGATAELRNDTVNIIPSGIGGKVLQVISTTKTDTFTTSSTSFVDVTGLSVAITPMSATSEIMIFVNIFTSNTVSGFRAYTALLRDTVHIALGDAAGSRTRVSGFSRDDSVQGMPSSTITINDNPATTSPITYKIQLKAEGNTATLNRSGGDNDASFSPRVTSTITVMEIGV